MAGCAVGPNFSKPAAPHVSDYAARPLSSTVATANVAGGQAQHFAEGADISGDWWTLFHSKALNALIERSLKNNHGLKAAQAALSVAREDVLAQRGAYYPSVTANFSASRQRDPRTISPVPNSNVFQYSLFTPQVSVSYVPDVFGLNRRSVESLKAQEQAIRYQMIAAYTMLTANVIVAAIQEASLKAQIDATRQLIGIGARSLHILRYQFKKNYTSKLAVAAQQSQLAHIKGTLPPLVKQLTEQRNVLAVLIGRSPGQASNANFKLSDLHLPQKLPVSLPSRLVAERPDVLESKANLHTASAQVGIAVAKRLPNINLTADVGSTALAISRVFTSGTGFWGLAATVMAPIFEGGTLLHQERAAKAAYVQSAEAYRNTVLHAFEDVADTLAALHEDAKSLKAEAAAAKAANVTLNLSQRQSRAGYGDYLSLLNAEQAYQKARISQVRAEANRYADTVALFQALGGGWWHRPNLTKNQDKHI